MLIWIILVPLLAALAGLAVPSNRWRPWVLLPAAAAHLAISLLCITKASSPTAYGWLFLDPPGRLVLLLISVLFLICSVYTIGYLQYRPDRSNRVFVMCLLIFLGVASLVTCAHHLGLMWVAVEATTLSTAPLIYFNRTARSIEATWKYLLVGSVGLAIALLGSFFLAYASLGNGGEPSLLFEDLLRRAPLLNKPWLEAAFVLLLVGYGTKMGLAPMHTWKPDAYGEAPGVVGALLAGGVTSCAFLALLRIHHICEAAGESPYVGRLMVCMGLFSMAVAAVFMVGQRDIKRMLAYSSVEHMGILIIGAGIGGPALFGALLHMMNNGITKGLLFLSAGNIHRSYDSKSTDEVRGAMRRLPLSGTLFLLGFFAITGSPPFGPFVSEFTILSGAFAGGRFLVGAGFLLLLLVVFIGMGRTVLTVVQGRPLARGKATEYRDGLLTGLPIVVSLGIVLLLGVHIPAFLGGLLNNAASSLEMKP
jgi:hydrogenase-4 component F